MDLKFRKNKNKTKTANKAPVKALEATSDIERSIMLVVFTISVITISFGTVEIIEAIFF